MRHDDPASWRLESRSAGVGPRTPRVDSRAARVLFVDDDPGLLTLLRTTFELIDIEIDEAVTAAEATAAIAARAPDVVVLDIGLPGEDGISLCRRLKADPATSWIGIVLLTGAGSAEQPAREAGADVFLRKPFSPLELLSIVEHLAGGLYEGPFSTGVAARGRRAAAAVRERPAPPARDRARPPGAPAADVPPDRGCARRRARVEGPRHRLALAARPALRGRAAQAIEPALLHDPSVEYGFLLHDVGKIGIPDHVLQKRGPLNVAEQQLMRTHTVLGEQLLVDVDLLHGDGLKVVRGHHERWDGSGYPDGLARRRDSPRGAHLRPRRHARCDHERPPVPGGTVLAGCCRRDPPRARAPVRPGCGGRVLRLRARPARDQA